MASIGDLTVNVRTVKGEAGPDTERRFLAACELRAEDGDGEGALPRLRGYAAVFNKLSEEMWDFEFGMFQERIAPGAFKRTLADGADVRAVIEHESGLMTIGRSTNGTLEMREDKRGLDVTIRPPDTQAGRDAVTLVRGGFLDKMSFLFRVQDGGDEWDDSGRPAIRTLTDVNLDGGDVSIVTSPAYPDTSIAVRSLEQWRGNRKVHLGLATQRLRVRAAFMD